MTKARILRSPTGLDIPEEVVSLCGNAGIYGYSLARAEVIRRICVGIDPTSADDEAEQELRLAAAFAFLSGVLAGIVSGCVDEESAAMARKFLAMGTEYGSDMAEKFRSTCVVGTETDA